jgi:hypothetical protein
VVIVTLIIGFAIGLLLSTKFKLPFYDRYERWVWDTFYDGWRP